MAKLTDEQKRQNLLARRPKRGRPRKLKKKKKLTLRSRGGSIYEIAQLFFQPLLKYKPRTWSQSAWKQFLFCYSTRDITRYQAKREFVLPGIRYAAAAVLEQGTGYKKIRRGQLMFVRTDSTTPEIVDVEIATGVGQADQVFRLNGAEWRSVVTKVVKL